MSQHPEHDRLMEVKDEAEVLGSFLEWLQTKFYLCDTKIDVKLGYFNHPSVYCTSRGIEDILYEYYKIDQREIEKEKQEMLKELTTK